ncbi:MAG: hypothetical protein ACI9J3_001590 [Parvicellaceae bacterium]|jgi:hypothetical protein
MKGRQGIIEHRIWEQGIMRLLQEKKARAATVEKQFQHILS